MKHPASRILILGGGAAGIVAAIAAAETAPANTTVTLLERNHRVGKKLLATGNGRCNLDNAHVHPSCYTSSASGPLLNQALEAVNHANPLKWFHDHGLVTRSDQEGRVYPYSNQAADVVNLLLYWLERSRVEVRTDCTVSDVVPENGRFAVSTEGGDVFRADRVICALGGQAGPKFGCDGFSARLTQKLGLPVLPEYPCLTPLACEKSLVSGLGGIRVKAVVSLTDGDALLAQEEGEVQFTDYGLSGIAVMQLSRFLKPNKGPRRPMLRLNLFPQWTQKELTALLHQRIQLLGQGDCAVLMTGLVPHRVGAAVWKAAGLGRRSLSALTERDVHTLARTFQNWVFPAPAPLGWQQAQATGGGVSLEAVDCHSFVLKAYPNLYWVGEGLDCVGACGGYNLHWAFGSALCAARNAARKPRGPKKR